MGGVKMQSIKIGKERESDVCSKEPSRLLVINKRIHHLHQEMVTVSERLRQMESRAHGDRPEIVSAVGGTKPAPAPPGLVSEIEETLNFCNDALNVIHEKINLL